MIDQFNIIDNVLPKSWINYIGFYTLPVLNARTNVFDMYNQSNQLNNSKKSEILNGIDIGMKNLLTTVCIHENDFNLFNYTKELTRINEEYDLISPFLSFNTGNKIKRKNPSKKKVYDNETILNNGTNFTVKSSVFDA